ncbi:MAG: sodium-dependent transporter, partial [Acutalibacteraceae bacterium]|nr:sodium-dependent transporter [Acutalibacteraceae bacterium]
ALMCAEIAIGRKTGTSALGAYKKLDKRFGFLGIVASLVPTIILPYYSVIGGWIAKYLFTFVSGNMASATNDSFFSDFISSPIEPIGWFLLYLGVTALVVLGGVEKGIEKVSKVMMPVLVVMVIFIAVYSMFMPGALEGVKYYLTPDFSKFSITTVLAAMGQLFYSMSLAMGIMITYGSYMKKDLSLENSVKQIELFDTGIAFFAGLMIIPAVFSFSGGDESALGKGPSLMFVTLPKVFETMTGGSVIGTIFFLMVLFAALTSSISLMETIVSIVMDKFGLSRKKACLTVILLSIILGLLSTLGYSIWSDFTIIGFQFLDFFDFISNSVIMPIVALLTCILIGYIIKPQALIEEIAQGGKFKRKTLFTIVIKYIAPVCIVAILIFSVLEGFGIIKV